MSSIKRYLHTCSRRCDRSRVPCSHGYTHPHTPCPQPSPYPSILGATETGYVTSTQLQAPVASLASTCSKHQPYICMYVRSFAIVDDVMQTIRHNTSIKTTSLSHRFTCRRILHQNTKAGKCLMIRNSVCRRISRAALATADRGRWNIPTPCCNIREQSARCYRQLWRHFVVSEIQYKN